MNKKRALAVVDSIDAERLNMGLWATAPRGNACRTVMCYAGWAATHAGDPPSFAPEHMFQAGPDQATERTRSGRHIYAVAQHYLELSHDEMCELFYAFDAETPNDLRKLIEFISIDAMSFDMDAREKLFR